MYDMTNKANKTSLFIYQFAVICSVFDYGVTAVSKSFIAFKKRTINKKITNNT